MSLKSFIFTICCLISIHQTTQAMPYRVRFPYAVLTDDFGLLNEKSDFAPDATAGFPHPYQERGLNGGYPYWSCFEFSKIEVKHKHWKDTTELGENRKMEEICSLEFVIKTDREIHRFIERRAYPNYKCERTIKEWTKITQNQAHVCFQAYDGEIVSEVKSASKALPEKIWTWSKIKTDLGMMDYFGGLL